MTAIIDALERAGEGEERDVALAISKALSRYYVKGTSDNRDHAPPYHSPWYLIDTDEADHSVGYPGDLVAEYDNGTEAHAHRMLLVAKSAIAALRARQQ